MSRYPSAKREGSEPGWSGDGEEDEVERLLARELAAALAPVPARDERLARANRATFVARGVELAAERRPAWTRWWGWGGVGRAALWAVALLLMLVGARGISLDSLPGDRLYPVKLAVEQVESHLYSPAQWEQVAARRRLREVTLLLVRPQQETAVSFQGSLHGTGRGDWSIAGLTLPLSPDQARLAAQSCEGTPVRVEAVIAAGEIHPSVITPTCLLASSN